MNDFKTIAAQSQMTAIEVDLNGQVVSDSIGNRFYSEFGGQDAAQFFDKTDKTIICLSSRTTKKTKNCSVFKTGLFFLSYFCLIVFQGSDVVRSRGHVNYAVTERGIANLFGLSVVERAKKLIRIFHPQNREFLQKFVFEMFKILV